ncbi:hypothetical protein M231_03881 [Tremella mesenterica]|uniref:Complex 1 LYR protein domain-containing protein n=1 Tax=Tremella mesenterica TaxID=5217 RepID=A0A4Q1BLZ0_TREME|nr:hypothetical protein M231_03881 [Tremella mesenterica]
MSSLYRFIFRPTTFRGFQGLQNVGKTGMRYASTIPSGPSPTAFPASAVDDVTELRKKAIKLYKELHRLGRDYPDPAYEFNRRLRRAYEKNATEKDPEKLRKQLELAEHIKKEVLALISLKKFRHLRRAYHPHEGPR